MSEFFPSEFPSAKRDSEPFGSFPHGSEGFGNVPNHSEPFRIVPKGAERKENHTLTVREAARMFEASGVARTERSIINWCQPNKTGIARLDAYFDPNERKYYVTLQSIELAIAEEKAKAAKGNPEFSEPFRNDLGFGNVRQEIAQEKSFVPGDDTEKVKTLEREILDLKILNSGKDYFINQLKGERDNFITQLVGSSRKIGELETRLLQIEESPQTARKLRVRNLSESPNDDDTTLKLMDF
jgi:hypothetical protein